MLICSSCDKPNREHRGFCGGCGDMLQAVCRGCRFVNDRGDRFCGGCGSALQPMSVALARHEDSPRSALPPAHADELSELFMTSATAPDEVLPAAGITQDDVDRLFGGAS